MGLYLYYMVATQHDKTIPEEGRFLSKKNLDDIQMFKRFHTFSTRKDWLMSYLAPLSLDMPKEEFNQHINHIRRHLDALERQRKGVTVTTASQIL